MLAMLLFFFLAKRWEHWVLSIFWCSGLWHHVVWLPTYLSKLGDHVPGYTVL